MSVQREAVVALQRSLLAEYEQSPDMFREIAAIEALLAETYRDRYSYELLQNSDDAGSTVVEIEETRTGSVYWSNNGRALETADVVSLCRSARSTKLGRSDTVGYRGIGFKSIAGVAEKVEVETEGLIFSFDRGAAVHLLGMAGHAAEEPSVPLIRIPVRIRSGQSMMGVRFLLNPPQGRTLSVQLDPISMLFLRHVKKISFHRIDQPPEILQLMRFDLRRTLRRTGHPDAEFELHSRSGVHVAIPLNASALSLVTARGRLCCFLPLEDNIGFPVLVSGNLLTDPSRTHAIVGSPRTEEVLAVAAAVVAGLLQDPRHSQFQRIWELCLSAEDPRASLESAKKDVTQMFWQSLGGAVDRRRWTFGYLPVSLHPEEVLHVVPKSAPRALYLREYKAAARALKSVLGLPPLNLADEVTAETYDRLSNETKAAISTNIVSNARAFGRNLTPAESRLVVEQYESPTSGPARPSSRPNQSDDSRGHFRDTMKRWRVAEKSVLEFLVRSGWNLEDVSEQNLGFDLLGVDADGEPVSVEVKKVDKFDGKFSMTNNEMSVMRSMQTQYWIAIVVGDGPTARLAMVDAKAANLVFDRVCRRWDWECSEWASQIEYSS